MIIGTNRVFAHQGKDYHIQAEDLGQEVGSFEVRVYDKGTVLWRKRVPYKDLLEKNLPKIEFEEAVRSQIEKTLHTVEAAIVKGKLSAEV